MGGQPETSVQVPDELRQRLPARSVPFTLQAVVPVPVDLRGRIVSFTIPAVTHHVTLLADGQEIPAEQELLPVRRSSGSMRWELRPPLTDRETIELQLRFDGFHFYGATMAAAPRLCADPNGDVDYVRARIVHEYAGLVTSTLGIILVIFYGIVYWINRRSEYGWFTLQVALAIPICVYLMGVTGFLGAGETTLLIVQGQGAIMAATEFAHAFYGKRPPPRILWVYIGLIIVFGFVGPRIFGPTAAERATLFLVMPYILPLSIYLVILHGRMLRDPIHRFDAAVFLFSNLQNLVAGFLTAPSGLGAPVMHGLNLMPISLGLYALAQVVVLSRSHAIRERENRALTDELRRQVADRSRELADALAQLRDGSSQSTPPSAGEMIDGRYRVLGVLGRGAMGVVYEGERESDGKRLAIKVIANVVTPQAAARFAREAQLLAQVRHPHLVEVWDVGIESSGRFFMVMELVSGAALTAHRKRFGDTGWALPILSQIARGLAAIHEQGIVHRDLKPGNVLLTNGGMVKIADFGVAAVAPDARGETEQESQPLTRTGALLGTPRYMAPELAGGARDARPSADIFGFGVMAYELLTEQSPFQVPPVRARMDGLSTAPAQPLAVAGLSAEISSCLHRCVHLDPAQRPTATEILSVLARSAAA